LAGYILNVTGQIPRVGEVFTQENLQFEILKKSASRLELIKLSEISTENN
jgi:CBS domain containing-hemolysin-like protein